MELINSDKKGKRLLLLDAAKDCFLNKGIDNTTIDDIVNKAEVAKGTFYLYFHNKRDIFNDLAMQLSFDIIKSSYNKALKKYKDVSMDGVKFFINDIIEYFKKNQPLLRFLGRNFSLPTAFDYLDKNKDEEMFQIINSIYKNTPLSKYTFKEAYHIMFMLIEMVSSTCYSCIILQEPTDIDDMKPTIFLMVEKMMA